MYLNVKYIRGKDLSLTDVLVLQLAKQQKSEDLSEELQVYSVELEILMKEGYLKKIKGKKKDPEVSKYRISKEGNKLLADIETPDVEEEDIVLFEWMKGKYLDMDKKLGNQKKTKLYIALFRVHSGIEKNQLAFLMHTFLEDERNMEYNLVMEYALYKPQNVYNTRFNLDESRLYQYYLTHKEFFDEKFEEI